MGSGPIPVGIDGLNATPFVDFRGGRVTMDNLSQMRKEEILLANNIVILNDRMPTLRPGYTLVRNVVADLPFGGGFLLPSPILSIFDFQRDIDAKQFIIVSTIGASPELFYLDPTQAYKAIPVANATTPLGPCGFAQTLYELFIGSQNAALTLFDSDGQLVADSWGVTPPVDAPTLTVVPGAATTTYGWTYAYCFARTWFDAAGNFYTHVGPPSPIAFQGPITGGAVQIQGDAVPGFHPFWSEIWIFRSNDTPQGTTSALFFLTFIPLSDGSNWPVTDDLPDTVLDLTRPIPYDNYPAPAGDIVEEYLSRVAVAGIAGSPDLVQLSGSDEIILGIPQECFPPDLFFDIPAGRKSVTAMKRFNQTLYISSLDFWWTFTGTDTTNFALRDKACEPGAVGKRAVCTTNTHLVFLCEDRALRAWDGVSTRPVEFSKNLSKQLVGCLSMEDIDAATLATAEVRWYHQGRYNIILVLVNTGSVPQGKFDWVQMWDASFLGELYDDEVTPVGLVETDFFPTDAITTSAIYKAGYQTYLAMGDDQGNIFRWPDGATDNGQQFSGALCTCWSPLNVFIGPMFHPIPQGEVVKRLFWADLHTDRQDAVSSFQMAAVVADSPDMTLTPSALPLRPLPASGGRQPAPTACRGFFYQVPGLAVGRWTRVYVIFPGDGGGGTLERLSIAAKPLYGIAP